MAARNWVAVKAEYIAGVPALDLSRKYSIPLATIESRASRESWGDERKAVASRVQADLPAAVARAVVEHAADDAIMGRDEVLRRLTSIARGGMRRVAEWGPGGVVLRDSSELSDDDQALVAEVAEVVNQHGTAVRIKVLDALAALRDLAKHHGIVGPEGKPGSGGLDAASPAAPVSDADLRALGVDELRRRLEAKARRLG